MKNKIKSPVIGNRKIRPPQGLFFRIFIVKIRANFPRGCKDTSKDMIYYFIEECLWSKGAKQDTALRRSWGSGGRAP